MRIFIRIFIFFFSFFFFQFSFAQESDSLNNALPVKYFSLKHFELFDSTNIPDYSLNNFSNYLTKNNLGNNGLAFAQQNYSFMDLEDVGFNYSINNYKNYFFTPQNLHYFNTRTPFTDLFYVIGSKKEQLIHLTFSYNVKKNWNFTAYFNRVRSEGFYQRQNTNDNYLAVSSNYKSLNGRYFLIGSIIFNSAKNAENGGILNDSLFAISDNNDKKLVGINLAGAKRTNNNKVFYLSQYFNIGKITVDTLGNSKISAKSRIILSTQYEDNTLKYEDDVPYSGFYSKIYFDSTRTFDSIYYRKIENEIIWKKINSENSSDFIQKLAYQAGFKHQLIKVEQRELFKNAGNPSIYGLVNTTQSIVDSVINNVIAEGALYNLSSNKQFWWNFGLNYGVSGYNKGNHYLNLSLKKNLLDSLLTIGFTAEDKLKAPDFIYNRYLSNHFVWSNNFDKTREARVVGCFRVNKYNLDINLAYSSYSNLIYFNDSAIAAQKKGSVPVFATCVNKNFVVGKWHLNNKINYQYVTNGSVIRLPQFSFNHSLYYEKDILKGVARLQTGISLFYFTSYYANAYMPATGQFYFQDNKKYGNYPFIDFFISARIKTVRVFFKIDHLNSDLMGNNYMVVPNYPINGRAFKFGVSWLFYD